MLTKKQFRMFELLSEMVLDCQDCKLWQNDCCVPYFHKESKYMIVGEAPGADEIKQGEPFVGKAGGILWRNMKEIGLSKKDFIIVNSVNCRPVDDYGRNGKPNFSEIEICNQWLMKYLKVLKPKNILSLGNFALWNLSRHNGITAYNGISEYFPDFDTTVTYAVHPAYIIYNGYMAEKALQRALKEFKRALKEFKSKVEENG